MKSAKACNKERMNHAICVLQASRIHFYCRKITVVACQSPVRFINKLLWTSAQHICAICHTIQITDSDSETVIFSWVMNYTNSYFDIQLYTAKWLDTWHSSISASLLSDLFNAMEYNKEDITFVIIYNDIKITTFLQ